MYITDNYFSAPLTRVLSSATARGSCGCALRLGLTLEAL